MRFSIAISTVALLLTSTAAAAPECTDCPPGAKPKLDFPHTSKAPADVLVNSPGHRCTTQLCLYHLPTPRIRSELLKTFKAKHFPGTTTSITLSPGESRCVVCNGGVLIYTYTRFDGKPEPKTAEYEDLEHDAMGMINIKKRAYTPYGSKEEGWRATWLYGIVEEDWVESCRGITCEEEGKAGEWTEEELRHLYDDPYKGCVCPKEGGLCHCAGRFADEL